MSDTARAAEVLRRCREISRCTEVPGAITRGYLSEPMHVVHRLLREWMSAAGMEVRVDAAGNLRGLRRTFTPGARRLLLGSHLDTVPDAGAFDGVFGVVLAIAAVEALGTLADLPLPYEIEVIGFAEEEGVCFGKPFLGSLALGGQLDLATLARSDRHGITVAERLRAFGGNPDNLSDALLAANTAAYIEAHIEQGPVLDTAGEPLAVVTSIVGQSRLLFRFCGQANHAGTTPMHLRRDPVAAAAEWIVAIERLASEISGLAATTGQIRAHPGAVNVIAGEVEATLDVRHETDLTRESFVRSAIDSAREIAARRCITVDAQLQSRQSSMRMDGALVSQLRSAAEEAVGAPVRTMPSGAGHDAMILARSVPSAMLFVRSPGGISHHPDEDVLLEDTAAALRTLDAFLHRFGKTGTLGSPDIFGGNGSDAHA